MLQFKEFILEKDAQQLKTTESGTYQEWKNGLYLYFVLYNSPASGSKDILYVGIKYKDGSKTHPNNFWGGLRYNPERKQFYVIDGQSKFWEKNWIKDNQAKGDPSMYMSSAGKNQDSDSLAHAFKKGLYKGEPEELDSSFHPWILNSYTKSNIDKLVHYRHNKEEYDKWKTQEAKNSRVRKKYNSLRKGPQGMKNPEFIKALENDPDYQKQDPLPELLTKHGLETTDEVSAGKKVPTDSYMYKIFVVGDMEKFYSVMKKLNTAAGDSNLPKGMKELIDKIKKDKNFKQGMIKEFTNTLFEDNNLFEIIIDFYIKNDNHDIHEHKEFKSENLYRSFIISSVGKHQNLIVGTIESFISLKKSKMNENDQGKSTMKVVPLKYEYVEEVFIPKDIKGKEKDELAHYISKTIGTKKKSESKVAEPDKKHKKEELHDLKDIRKILLKDKKHIDIHARRCFLPVKMGKKETNKKTIKDIREHGHHDGDHVYSAIHHEIINGVNKDNTKDLLKAYNYFSNIELPILLIYASSTQLKNTIICSLKNKNEVNLICKTSANSNYKLEEKQVDIDDVADDSKREELNPFTLYDFLLFMHTHKKARRVLEPVKPSMNIGRFVEMEFDYESQDREQLIEDWADMMGWDEEKEEKSKTKKVTEESYSPVSFPIFESYINQNSMLLEYKDELSGKHEDMEKLFKQMIPKIEAQKELKGKDPNTQGLKFFLHVLAADKNPYSKIFLDTGHSDGRVVSLDELQEFLLHLYHIPELIVGKETEKEEETEKKTETKKETQNKKETSAKGIFSNILGDLKKQGKKLTSSISPELALASYEEDPDAKVITEKKLKSFKEVKDKDNES